MTNKGKLVLNDYMNLSDEDKKEVKALIQSYENKDGSGQTSERRQLNEEIKRVVGPTSSGYCSQCGRG